MTETMLTKAAKAICQAKSRRNGWNPDRAWAASRNEFIEDAAVALEAIREPDDVTAEAGWMNAEHTLEGMGPDFPSYVESCQNIFTAMIDSIFSQSQEGSSK